MLCNKRSRKIDYVIILCKKDYVIMKMRSLHNLIKLCLIIIYVMLRFVIL